MEYFDNTPMPMPPPMPIHECSSPVRSRCVVNKTMTVQANRSKVLYCSRELKTSAMGRVASRVMIWAAREPPSSRAMRPVSTRVMALDSSGQAQHLRARC